MSNANHSLWLQAWHIYTRAPVIAMLFLGFSAGLPLLLVFGTLSAWLREVGVDRSTIGHISWIATLYAGKFIWAPIIDLISIPVITSLLGHRRGWMLIAQLGIIIGLLAMTMSDPVDQLGILVSAAVMVAFCSATQDISIDAWRIEATNAELQGAMAASYQMGYRLGMIVAGAGALYLAEYFSWGISYAVMATTMLVGMTTVLLIPEPDCRRNPITWGQENQGMQLVHSNPWSTPYRIIIAQFIRMVVCPFSDFFSRYKKLALVILAFIGIFRLSDITMGVMANPFYIDMGYSKVDIANVTKVFGLIMTMVGAAIGGIMVARFAILKILLVSAILVAITNLIFAWLAMQGPDIRWLTLVISADNFSAGIAGSAFIAYLSGLINRAYTATQYALFSSLMLLPAKFLGGFSGDIVDATNYVFFFCYAAMLGLPAIFLIIWLIQWPQSNALRK